MRCDFIDRVKCEEAERALAEGVHRERQRIAHDLHDSLGQLLTGIAFKAHALENSLRQLGCEHAEATAELVALANEASGQARDLVHGLGAIGDSGSPFSRVLRQLAKATGRLFRLDGEFVQTGEEPVLSSQVTTQLYRAVQEAVTNAVRHSRARRIVIGLSHLGSHVEISVTDDGDGMPVSLHRGCAEGMGIRLMRYRMKALGGALGIGSAETGSGTRVVFSVPIDATGCLRGDAED